MSVKAQPTQTCPKYGERAKEHLTLFDIIPTELTLTHSSISLKIS